VELSLLTATVAAASIGVGIGAAGVLEAELAAFVIELKSLIEG
jgi:hypothetical protein